MAVKDRVAARSIVSEHMRVKERGRDDREGENEKGGKWMEGREEEKRVMKR